MKSPSEMPPQRIASIQRKGLKESLMMALGASLFFVSWGIYANWTHGTEAILQVAFTQGAISFISTFLSTELLRFLYLAFQKLGIHGILTVPIGFTLINGSIYFAHKIAGTPELILTMLPGMTISIFFCCGYTYRLHRFFKIEK